MVGQFFNMFNQSRILILKLQSDDDDEISLVKREKSVIVSTPFIAVAVLPYFYFRIMKVCPLNSLILAKFFKV